MLFFNKLTIPVGRVSLPVFAAAHTDLARLRAALKLSVEGLASIAMPAFLGLAVIAGDLVPLLFGAQWAAAVPTVQLALLLGPAMGIQGVLRAMLLALGHGRTVLWLALGGTVLLTAMLLALPTVSVTGIMLILLARTYAMLPIRLLTAARCAEMEAWSLARAMTIPLLPAVAMALVLLATRHWLLPDLSAATWVPLAVLGGAVVHFGLLALIWRDHVNRLLAAQHCRAGAAAPLPGKE